MNPDAETTYLVHGMKKFKGSMSFKTGMEKSSKRGAWTVGSLI